MPVMPAAMMPAAMMPPPSGPPMLYGKLVSHPAQATYASHDLRPQPQAAPEPTRVTLVSNGVDHEPDQGHAGNDAAGRRDTRDRMLLAAAGLLAFFAIGGSMLALHRTVPFLDVTIEQASASRRATTVSTTTTTTGATTTSASTTTVPVTVPVPTTSAEVSILTPTEETLPESAPQDELTDDEPVEAAPVEDVEPPTTVPGGAPGDGVGVATTLPPTPTSEVPADTTPTSTVPTTPTTTGPTSTTTPAAPQLQVTLTCQGDKAGPTLTALTAGTDGTVNRLRVEGFVSGCRAKTAKVALRNGQTVLGTATATVKRTGNVYYVDITQFSAPVPLAQVTIVAIGN